MEVLITGATGFIGRALCKRMVTEGWKVRGSGRSAKYVARLPAGCSIVHTDSIGPDTDWTKSLAGVDAVVHLAARVHLRRDITTDPLSAYHKMNVAGTERLARMAAATGVRRFVFMSSVKVNGEKTGVSLRPIGPCAPEGDWDGKPKEAFSEKDVPAPQDPYAVSKWEAEQLLHEIGKETGLDIVILRPPLVYGAGVKANFLRLLQIVDRGIPLPLKSVNNSRSLIYLGNLVDAVLTCINNPKASGKTYLVSDGDDVSTPDLIRRIATAMGKPARLFPLPPLLIRIAARIIRQSAAMDRLLGTLTIDSKKIHLELKWKPPYTMEHGLLKTVEWYLKEDWRQELGVRS